MEMVPGTSLEKTACRARGKGKEAMLLATGGLRVRRGQQSSVAHWGLNRCHLTLVRSRMGWTWLELRGVGRDQQQTATLVSGGVVFGFSQKQAVTLCC